MQSSDSSYPKQPYYQQEPNAPPMYSEMPQPSEPYHPHGASSVPPQGSGMMPHIMPQAGYMQAGTTNIVIIPGHMQFGDLPQQLQCPNCHANILTRMVRKTGTLSWLLCAGLCVVGCWAGCCLLPFCIDSCKDVEHYCPNCNSMVGCHRKL